MKTLLIYTETPDEVPQFAIVDGDYSRFNGVDFNATFHPHGYECEVFLFNGSTSKTNFPFTYDMKLLEEKQWDKVAFLTF